MTCARPSRTRVRRSCARDASRQLPLLLPLLLVSCGGLYQRALPSQIDTYEHAFAGAMRVGFAEADITPQRPTEHYLAGFVLNKKATAVHSRLKARAMVVEVGGRPIAIVGIDNLGIGREDCDWIKRALTGFAAGDVFLCPSHTHAGPDLVGLWGKYFLTSGRDEEYLAAVRRGIADAVLRARRGAVPATLHQGAARLPPEGIVGNSNRKGVFNRRVTVLAAKGADGRALGAMLQVVCHPEMMRRNNTLMSADFVGELCDRWRGAGHGQAVFVNGELGAMITPSFRPRGAEGMPMVGAKLLAICERALAAAAQLDARDVLIRRRDVYLPLETAGLTFGRLTGVVRRELYAGCVRSSVGYLRIGAFEAIAVPGELEPVLATEIRAALRRPNALFFGLCDDEIGYILRREDAVDPLFDYERTMSPGRDAGELIRAAVVGK